MDCLLPRPCDLCRRDIERERIERSMSLEEEAEYDRQVDSPPPPQLETDRTQRCNLLVSGSRGHASGDIMVLIKRVSISGATVERGAATHHAGARRTTRLVAARLTRVQTQQKNSLEHRICALKTWHVYRG